MASPIPVGGYSIPMTGKIVSLPIPSLSGLSVSQPRLAGAGGTNRITKGTTYPYTIVWGFNASTPLTLEAIAYKKKIIQTTCPAGSTDVLSNETFWVNVYRELDPVNYYSKIIQHSNSGHGTTVQGQSYHSSNNSDPSKGILWIPKVVVNGNVTSYLWLSDKVASPGELGTANNLGTLAHSDGEFAYYWKDDTTYPSVVAGSATSNEKIVAITPNGKSIAVIDPLLVYTKDKTEAKLYYNRGYDVVSGGQAVKPGSGSGNVDAPYWSPFYIEYGGVRCAIAMTQYDNNRVESWMGNSDIPAQPEKPIEGIGYTFSGPLAAGVSAGVNLPMKYKLDVLTKGFGFLNSSKNWEVNAQVMQISMGNFTNVDYATGKWIVLPGVHTTSSQSTVSTPSGSVPGGVFSTAAYDNTISAADARSYFNPGSTGLLKSGEHWGVFDNQAKAQAWATWINNTIDIYNKAKVAVVTGLVCININNSKTWLKISFNPYGLNGIPDASWEPFSSGPSNNPGGTNASSSSSSSSSSGSSSSSSSGSSSSATYDPYGLGPGVRLTVANSVSLLLNNGNKNQLAKNILVSLTKDLGQSWALTKAQLIKSLTAARIQALVDKGVDISVAKARIAGDAQIAYLTTLAKPVAGGTNSGGGNGNTNSPTGPDVKKTQKITITRGLVGYMPPPSARSTRPQLVQQYRYTETTYSENSKQSVSTQVEIDPLIYEFPFTPREITYSGLGSTWTEIARAGNFPIVDWQSYQLLKISFNFDVVDRSSLPGTTGFGLVDSVDGQLNVLRKMALAPYPVSFLNMDEIMSKELRYPLFTKGRGVEFVINDFTITSVQRTGGAQSQISRASCSMTLQEIPIENANIVYMPPITPCKPKTCPPPTICKKEPCVNNSTFLLASTLVTGIK